MAPRKGNRSVAQADAAEAADLAQGKANLAANLASENAEAEAATPAASEPVSNHTRGRKPSNRLTFAKFVSAVKSGTALEGMTRVPDTIGANNVMVLAHWTTQNLVDYDEETGVLSIARFITTSRNKAIRVPLHSASPAQVLEFLNSLS